MTSEETVTPDRMNAFSDGVFAVIITILVLDRTARTSITTIWLVLVSMKFSSTSLAITRATSRSTPHSKKSHQRYLGERAGK